MRVSIEILQWLLPLAFATSTTASSLLAKIKTPINNTLEQGVATECKTCPYSLCTNKAFYDYGTTVSLECWTRGTVIAEDSTWLRTSDDCYVTQYDLQEYNGTYEKDLSYCGKDSEELNLTYDAATVIYDSECNLCPTNTDCAIIKYLSPGTELTVTCWTSEGGAVIGDTTWLKTTDNCYVNELGLDSPANTDILDNCGPIGFIQLNDTSSGSSEERSLPPSPSSITLDTPPIEPRATQYLTNLTIGEDIAICYSCANTTCEKVTRYRFMQEVWVQCAIKDAGEMWWFETTDFCFVKESDFWESLGDLYRYPTCDHFESQVGLGAK